VAQADSPQTTAESPLLTQLGLSVQIKSGPEGPLSDSVLSELNNCQPFPAPTTTALTAVGLWTGSPSGRRASESEAATAAVVEC